MNSMIFLLNKSRLLSLSLYWSRLRPRRGSITLGGRLGLPCRHVIYFLYRGWDFDQCGRKCRESSHRLGSSRRAHRLLRPCRSLKSPGDIHVRGCAVNCVFGAEMWCRGDVVISMVMNDYKLTIDLRDRNMINAQEEKEKAGAYLQHVAEDAL
jgi:hypothetical protein